MHANPLTAALAAKQRRRVSLVLLAMMTGCSVLSAQTPYTLPRSEVRDLPAPSSNGQSYRLFVSLPVSYATSAETRRYPVIYVCDPHVDFPLAATVADFARRDGHAPEALVVGIGYGGTNPDVGRSRQWDLTPGNDPVYDAPGTVTGHAEEFLTVIAEEIIPFVQTTYRVDPGFRVLIGHSFGGLFVTYAAFQRPNLFHGIVACSPSLDWRDEFVLSLAQQHASTGASLNTRIFMGWGDGDEEGIVSSSRNFAATVQALGIPGLQMAADVVEGTEHNGNKPESFARGIRFVFKPQAWVPTVGRDPGYGDIGRLINISTRGYVSGGERVLIGGLIVEGVLPKRVLIRAAGPSLGPLGVNDALRDPRLRVVDVTNATVATNDDWDDGNTADDAAIVAATTESGAFAFPIGGRDSAVIVRLAPGQYTVVVESADGTEGVALVEAYELSP